MARTQLEMYISVVNSLLKHGPTRLDEIISLIDVDMKWLKEHIGVLVEQGLVIKQENCATATFVITDSGDRILKFFRVKSLT